jgi:hypothetical protein
MLDGGEGGHQEEGNDGQEKKRETQPLSDVDFQGNGTIPKVKKNVAPAPSEASAQVFPPWRWMIR